MQHSPDHRLIAWSADDNGSEYDTLRVRDLATGADLADVDPGRRGRAGVDRGFIRLLLRAARRQSPPLARLSPSARHAGRGRRAGLRGAGQPLSSSRSGSTQSGRFADISVHDHETSESWLIDLHRCRTRRRGWSRRARRRCSTTSSITPTGPGEETLVVRTNADGAEDFKIAVTPLARPGRDELARSRAAPARHLRALRRRCWPTG